MTFDFICFYCKYFLLHKGGNGWTSSMATLAPRRFSHLKAAPLAQLLSYVTLRCWWTTEPFGVSDFFLVYFFICATQTFQSRQENELDQQPQPYGVCVCVCVCLCVCVCVCVCVSLVTNGEKTWRGRPSAWLMFCARKAKTLMGLNSVSPVNRPIPIYIFVVCVYYLCDHYLLANNYRYC